MASLPRNIPMLLLHLLSAIISLSAAADAPSQALCRALDLSDWQFMDCSAYYGEHPEARMQQQLEQSKPKLKSQEHTSTVKKAEEMSKKAQEAQKVKAPVTEKDLDDLRTLRLFTLRTFLPPIYEVWNERVLGAFANFLGVLREVQKDVGFGKNFKQVIYSKGHVEFANAKVHQAYIALKHELSNVHPKDKRKSINLESFARFMGGRKEIFSVPERAYRHLIPKSFDKIKLFEALTKIRDDLHKKHVDPKAKESMAEHHIAEEQQPLFEAYRVLYNYLVELDIKTPAAIGKPANQIDPEVKTKIELALKSIHELPVDKIPEALKGHIDGLKIFLSGHQGAQARVEGSAHVNEDLSKAAALPVNKVDGTLTNDPKENALA